MFHFVTNNKASNFKFQDNIGPFVVKHRSSIKMINEILQGIQFQKGGKIRYDPYNIIANKRKKYKLPTYDNQFSVELHKAANQCRWENVNKILMEMNQQMDEQVMASLKALVTPLKQVEKTRRSEIEGSDMDIDEVHVNKIPKLSFDNEYEVEKYCMIIDPVPKSIEKNTNIQNRENSFNSGINRVSKDGS